MAWIRTDVVARAVAPSATSPPTGYGPHDIQAAYNFPSGASGAFQTVAIVDAYDDSKAESDLAVYRSTFKLPPCTTANGCFLKVNQDGGTSPLPSPDPSVCGNGTPGCWEEEEALDLDMASAVCPNCHLLLVEAADTKDANLFTAEDTAAAKCSATVISNSWSGNEDPTEHSAFDVHFNHPGIPITVASGDTGYPGGYPGASPYVTAVGGTTLNNAGTLGQTETVWPFTGSLCSAYEAQPTWQSALAIVKANPTDCTKRVDNDVAAVGDPSTGVAVYTTFGGDQGWIEFGGTSVATPIIAAAYALAGNGGAINDASFLYSHASAFRDITSGNNRPCGLPPPNTSYVCNAETGYDGPTGLGVPNGVSGL